MLNLIVSLLILPLMATDTAKQVRFTPKDLPYAYDALAPQVSEETLRFHHDKHYVGYVNKLNELIVDTPYAEQPLEDIVVSADGAIFNNAAQMWNHEFFFDELSPKAQTRPTGALLKAIDDNFGSFDQLKVQMEKVLTISTTATAAPMLSQPSGTASTGRSSKSATPRNSGFRLGKDAVSRFRERRFFVPGFHAAEGFRGRRTIFRRIYRIGNIIYFRRSPQKILAGKNWWKWQKVLPLTYWRN